MMATVLSLQEIRSRVDVGALIDEIEAGFVLYSEGRVHVPPVGFMHFDDPPGDVHIKYGGIVGDEVWVLKTASAFHRNPERGPAVSDGVILVFSQKTGALELVLHDRCWLTDMRTAAAGAVAARHLARGTVERIGIVGTGVQARLQLELLAEVTACDRCLLWGRDPGKVAAMIEDVRARERIRSWGIEIEPAALDDLVSGCDLIVTATSAREPLIRADLVRPGTHVTAMGSDDHGKQELEAALLARADVVVADSRAQCVDHGECSHAVRAALLAETSIVELGEVIADPSRGRTSADQITVADLTGVAVQDIQIAKMVARAGAGR